MNSENNLRNIYLQFSSELDDVETVFECPTKEDMSNEINHLLQK